MNFQTFLYTSYVIWQVEGFSLHKIVHLPPVYNVVPGVSPPPLEIKPYILPPVHIDRSPVATTTSTSPNKKKQNLPQPFSPLKNISSPAKIQTTVDGNEQTQQPSFGPQENELFSENLVKKSFRPKKEKAPPKSRPFNVKKASSEELPPSNGEIKFSTELIPKIPLGNSAKVRINDNSQNSEVPSSQPNFDAKKISVPADVQRKKANSQKILNPQKYSKKETKKSLTTVSSKITSSFQNLDLFPHLDTQSGTREQV